MPYLDDGFTLATSRGYLPLRPQMPGLSESPPWLTDLQRPDDLEHLEARLADRVPAAVREFWTTPSLVRLLDSWRSADFLVETPRRICWEGTYHLLVCSHPHSGAICGARLLDGEDPPLYWGWEDAEDPLLFGCARFSDFIRHLVRSGPPRGHLPGE